MSSTGVMKTGAQDVLTELRTFVAGATRAVKTNPLELARTALSLLKTLPSSRDAVLEYFCTLFDSAVSKYVNQIENDVNPNTGSSHEDAVVAEIHNVLCNFVSNNPEAWAPIISTWSLELLGELSSRYAGRAHVPLTAGLNEALQLWMSCCATRALIDITTQCLSCLMHSNTETCINALLNTSVSHSPHFDWVVAHVGSCFPQTVITRVLSCGLKDFCQHGCVDQGTKSPKVLSVVGILGHLAGGHLRSIRRALLRLFEWSLEPADPGEAPEVAAQRRATVPFLLQLGSLSSILLRALTTDVLRALNMEMLPQLAELAPGWCMYLGSRSALESLLVHLARSCEEGGAQVLHLLLEGAAPTDRAHYHEPIANACHKVLELLLQELDLVVGSAATSNRSSAPLLTCLRQDVGFIQPLLLSSDCLRAQTAVRLVGLLGRRSTSVLVDALAFLLLRATTDEHLVALMRLATDATVIAAIEKERIDAGGCSILAQTLERAVSTTLQVDCTMDETPVHVSLHQLWCNVARLLKWEASQPPGSPTAHIVSGAVCSCLREASELLTAAPTPAVAHAVASVLDLVDFVAHDRYHMTEPKMPEMLRLAKALVAYFFLCVAERDWLTRLRGVGVCSRLFTRLSVFSPAVRALILRELLEGVLFHTPNYLFGAPIRSSGDVVPDVRLLQENHKQGTSALLAQRHSSMFHAGVIGSGPQRSNTEKALPKDVVASNINLLIEVLKACCTCSTAEETASSDAVASMALLLVELISPDVMYNGLPWPEEEFSRVTVERDLSVRQRFDECPVAWALLTFVASHRPALCYCSVLLRAIAATLMAQWSARRSAGPSEALCDVTVRLLETMALGQLLPPPLASLRQLIPHLQPQEVVQLLRDCVWNYMRDNVPSPALFMRDSSGLMWRDATQAVPGPQYTDTLRFILQKNIHKLGHLYPQLFPAASDH